jgi:hypothetical protein
MRYWLTALCDSLIAHSAHCTYPCLPSLACPYATLYGCACEECAHTVRSLSLTLARVRTCVQVFSHLVSDTELHFKRFCGNSKLCAAEVPFIVFGMLCEEEAISKLQFIAALYMNQQGYIRKVQCADKYLLQEVVHITLLPSQLLHPYLRVCHRIAWESLYER